METRLLEAYRRTRYRVEPQDGPAFELRVDRPCPALDALLRQHALACASFITAWNPRSQALPEAANRARQRLLAQDIAALELIALPGHGIPAEAGWSPEASLLVLGLDQAKGLALAARHAQNAIVFHALGEPSRLLLSPVAEAD